MKKIAIITHGFSLGGIEVASIASANYFVNNGYDVSVVAIYNSDHQVKVDPRIHIYEPSKQGVLNTAIYIRKTINSLKPDVVIAHGEWTNGFVYLSLYGIRVPIFLQDHMNPDIIPRFSRLRRVLNSFAYKRANGIIALSGYSKEGISKYYGAKNIRVIENPIRDLNLTAGIEENRIVCIGRMTKEKGHINLVKAFNMCKSQGWILDIVGDGYMMNDAKAAAGVNKNIIFHGFQKDINLYLSRAKIFVLPSLSECYPLALIEAMSAGKACVSTDCLSGKNNIAVNNVNGLVVPPGNVEALSTAMDMMMQDEILRNRLAKEATKIKDELTPEKIYSKYLDFIFNNRV